MSEIEKRIEALALVLVTDMEACKYSVGKEAAAYSALAAAEERGRQRVFADPEALARRFHETYERLAPEHGYETRRDSAVPWEKIPEKNRRLMIAVCAALAPRDSGKEG